MHVVLDEDDAVESDRLAVSAGIRLVLDLLVLEDIEDLGLSGRLISQAQGNLKNFRVCDLFAREVGILGVRRMDVGLEGRLRIGRFGRRKAHLDKFVRAGIENLEPSRGGVALSEFGVNGVGAQDRGEALVVIHKVGVLIAVSLFKVGARAAVQGCDFLFRERRRKVCVFDLGGRLRLAVGDGLLIVGAREIPLAGFFVPLGEGNACGPLALLRVHGVLGQSVDDDPGGVTVRKGAVLVPELRRGDGLDRVVGVGHGVVFSRKREGVFDDKELFVVLALLGGRLGDVIPRAHDIVTDIEPADLVLGGLFCGNRVGGNLEDVGTPPGRIDGHCGRARAHIAPGKEEGAQ